MWTGRFDLNTLRVDGNVFESGKKKLPIKKYPDRCGQALVSRQFLSPFQGADVLAKSLEKMGVSFLSLLHLWCFKISVQSSKQKQQI